MTYPDAFATDRWTLPTWEARRDLVPSLRLSDWDVDPLERVMLIALCVLGGVLLWMLATADDVTGMTARDACVITAVDDARAFASVMGDERPVPSAFAVQACAQQSG